MIRAPRVRSLVAIPLLLLALVHGAPVPGQKVSKLSNEALLDLGGKLYRAIWDHQSKRVSFLLKKGASPDAVGDLDAPLQTAIFRGDTAIFRKLLGAGANPRVKVRDWKLFSSYFHEFGNLYGDSIPLLFEAASQPNPVFARTLLERGADPKVVSHGINAAFVAARFDNLAVFRAIVDSLGGMTIPEYKQVAAYASLHGAFSVLDELKARRIPSNPDSLCKGLALAIKGRDTAKALAFLDHGTPLDPKNPTYYTPLLRAIDEDSRRLFDLLLDKGCNVNAQSKDGVSAVLLAAKKSDSTWLKRLLDKGADFDVTNADGQNALYDASAENIPMLVSRKIKLDVLDKKRVSPLLNACKHSRWSVARMLVEAGADVRPMSSEGETALSRAIGGYRFDVAQMILERGGNLNEVGLKGSTILQTAMASSGYRNDPNEFGWLLRHGADPSLPDASRRTPVELAAKMADWNRLALLVRYGATDDIKPYAAKLVAAAQELGDDSLATILVNRGCNLDAPDTTIAMRFDSYSRDVVYTKEPALIQAIRNHRTKGVAMLLRHGAKPDVVDRNRVPALLLAISLYELDVVKLLLENKADIAIRDPKQNGYQQYLARYPYLQMAELFTAKDGK
ncbi:MAG: hypothetical protein IPK50_19320 [Fibrobacterota bacterium]|nr:MAG: hypothetical protein IPK50_19320 [Fibrobacterota bacterium]